MAVFDGAGHGILAYKVADTAMRFIHNNLELPLVDIMTGLHKYLQGTRGGVLALATVEKETGVCECLALGNIGIKTFGSEDCRLQIRGGILGYEITNPILHKINLEVGDVLFMYSDGVLDRFGSNDVSEFFDLTAQGMADVVIESFSHDHDDASVIILKVTND